MSQIPAPSSRARLVFLAASVVLVAFNARPSLSSLGPVLPEAMHDTGLSPASAGLLTTLPVVCIGLFGLATPSFARRLGAELTVLVFTLLLAVGVALRGFGTAGPLILGCAMGGIGIGVVNVLLPGMIKSDFPKAQALMMGLYTMALCGGAAVAAGATVPLQHALGDSWALALAAWAVPAVVAAAVWSVQLSGGRAGAREPTPRTQGLWRSPLAWQVTMFVGLQSSLAYSIFAWLPPILRARGFSAIDAGLVVSGCILVQAPAALAAPALAARWRDQKAAVAICVACSVVGLAGCLYLPVASIWLWAVILGIGQGATFAIALTLIVMRSADGPTAARLSSMAQGIGYTVASVGPLLMGLLRTWTGGWFAAGVLLFIIAFASLAFGLLAARPLQITAEPVPDQPAPEAA
jgi:CP family cyanate transporter-like MFS transporter